MISTVAAHYLAADVPVVVLCHRREIALHLAKVLEAHCCIAPALCMADAGPTYWSSPLVLAMVPTLSRRLRKARQGRGGLVQLDEAHHATAPTWQKVIEHLAPDRLAGVTATPVSCNREPLGSVFDRLVLGPQPRQLVQQGHLCPARVLAPATLIDTAGVHTRHGVYVVGELEARARKIAGEVVPTWREHAEGRQTLVACCTVRHAVEVAELYRQTGLAAAHLDGDMATAERDRIMRDFAQGRLTVLTFMGMVDEGLDIPEAEVLQFLRPTRSLRLRRQQEGRVRRVQPGKADCLVLDHSDSWQHLPLPNEVVRWRLDAGGETGAEVERSRMAKPRGQPDGTVEVVHVSGRRFEEVKAERRRRRKRGRGNWPTIREQIRSPLHQQRILRAIRAGRIPAPVLIRGLEEDPKAGLCEWQVIGAHLGFKEGWAHHRNRATVERRTREEQRQQMQEAVDAEIERAVTRCIVGPGALRLVRVVGLHRGQVVVTLADAEGKMPIPYGRHAEAREKLERALAGLRRPVVLVGLPGADGHVVALLRRMQRAAEEEGRKEALAALG